jgi:hypothetical protein
MMANSANTSMTATEVAERHEEKLLMLGPVIERLGNELLDPLIEMTFTRMVETGIVAPPPEELAGADLNIEYVSILSQAQRAVGTNSIDRYLGTLGAVAGMKPNILDKLDEDKLADLYADMLGVDPNLIVAGDKLAMIRKARADQQQAAQAAQMASMDAATAKTLAETDTTQDSALTDVMNAFQGY